MALWLGVDVAAERKGFDAALVDECERRELRGGLSVAAVVELGAARAPALVAVDGPRTCAPDGHHARADELELARRGGGIRWAPPPAPGRGGGADYPWGAHGPA